MQFTWEQFYSEFADKVGEFAPAEKHKDLVSIVRRMFDESGTGLKIPKNGDFELADEIDPFTLFALINRGIKTSSKIALLQVAKRLLNIKAEVPKDFWGIPHANHNRVYYVWAGEPTYKKDIEGLWRLFTSALDYCRALVKQEMLPAEAFEEAFDAVVEQKGVGRASITMGLFWIRPECFIGLDSCNMAFLYGQSKLPKILLEKYEEEKLRCAGGRMYLQFCQDIRSAAGDGTLGYAGIKELSLASFKGKDSDEMSDGSHVDSTAGRRYWLCAPGDRAKMWNECLTEKYICLGWRELGDFRDYESREAMEEALSKSNGGAHRPKNGSLACWQFLNEVKPGDVVFAKRGLWSVLGVGVVEGDYEYNEEAEEFRSFRRVRWIKTGEQTPGEQLPQKTLTDLSEYQELVSKILAAFGLDEELKGFEDRGEGDPSYGPEAFLDEVFVSPGQYEELVKLLRRKKNLILKGAPGVGKTFAAKRLAWSMMGERDASRIRLVQFHQSYSYEDFICGYKPNSAGGFDMRKGVFLDFCDEAANDLEREYFFIIDEINRGNISKIFGELLMLIEADKRGRREYAVRLAYENDHLFSVPPNLFIIGMMNTADRSLAMIDYALRRRFSFFNMTPAFDTAGFKKMLGDDLKMAKLVTAVKALNTVITNDPSLGGGFEIGHSYFCDKDASAESIVKYELEPTIDEYWFDNAKRAQEEKSKLENALK